MQLNYKQFKGKTNRAISPVTILTGDEPLLLQESRELIFQQAKKDGFSSRDIVFADHQFKTEQLEELTESMSLFANKRVIDIRQQTSKLPSSFYTWLKNYSERINPDVSIVISLPKLTQAQKKAKWFTSIDKVSTIVTIWPISANELPQWISLNFKDRKKTADQQAILMLAHFTEGNLLATHQAINKVCITANENHITLDDVKQVIHDSARFTVFDFIEFALLGHSRKSLRILNQLKLSGTEPTLVLWALSKEIRLMQEIQFLKQKNMRYQNIIQKQWKSRQKSISDAASRLTLNSCNNMIKLCHQADKSIKGLSTQDCWLILEKITLGLSQQSAAA